MENNKSEMDRHKFPRLKTSNLVSYEVCNDVDLETEGLGITQNISLGGLMFEVNRAFPIGTVISVDIALFDKIINARGRVVHVQEIGSGKYDLGMKFIDITQKHFDILWEYLETKRKKTYNYTYPRKKFRN